MESPVNRFKSKLAHPPAFGCWLGLASAYSAEMIATTGFDWLLIDGEHAPNTVATILEQLRAIDPYPAAPVVRCWNQDPALIKRLLDIGAHTLMVPMVDTPDQARRIVAAMRYAPAGIRGMASGVVRASRWGAIPDYVENTDQTLCLIAQIESPEGVRNAQAIAEIDGVDAVFIGPMDLSTSMGHLGDHHHPDVQAAIAQAAQAVRKAGKGLGILAPDPTDADHFAAAGYDFIATGLDVLLLRSAAVANAQRNRAK